MLAVVAEPAQGCRRDGCPLADLEPVHLAADLVDNSDAFLAEHDAVHVVVGAKETGDVGGAQRCHRDQDPLLR